MFLKEIRNQKNFSIDDLSHISGIPKRTIEDIEARKDCKVSMAVSLASALGVSLNDLCISTGANTLVYKYRIANATDRANTDLLNHSGTITAAINKLFPNVKIAIFTQHFEISSSYPLPSTKLREMGKDIANNDYYLRSLVKTYSYTRSNGQTANSNQLFRSFV